MPALRTVHAVCLGAVLLAQVSAAGAYDVTLSGLLGEATDLMRLTAPASPAYASASTSSRDRDSIAPGQPGWFDNDDYGNFVRVETHDGRTEYVLLDAAGPGAVVRMWSANAVGTLRVYVDGASVPALETGMNPLLAGLVSPFLPPLGQRTAIGMNLYFPIPYQTGIKITTDSNAPALGFGLYYNVAYRTYEPGTTVEPFSMAAVNAAAAQIQAVRAILQTPETAYAPSPDAVLAQGALEINGTPLVLTAPRGAVAGVLRRLQLNPAATDETTLRGILLEIACDGTTTVRVPLGDFFGTGPRLNLQESLPSSVRTDGTLISRWPMPFHSTLALTLTSTLPDLPPVPYQIHVEPHTPGPAAFQFHAGWRKDHAPAFRPDADWTTLALEGNGVYAGNVLNVTSPFITPDDWWGEGDEKIWIDGESFPSHFGTGTEDYYGYAWANRTLFRHAYHGQTRCDADPQFHGRTSVNRFHVLDAIPFQSALRFDLEHRTVPGNPDNAVLFDMTSYWYAAPEATDDLPVLGAGDMTLAPLPPRIEKAIPGTVLQAENLSVVQQDGVSAPRSTANLEYDGRIWSAQRHRFWWASAPGHRLSLGFTLALGGSYCAHAYLTRNVNGPQVGVGLDGDASVPIELWQAIATPAAALRLGTFDLAAGAHTLDLEVLAGSAANSCETCQYSGVDALSLVPAAAPPGVPLLRIGSQGLAWVADPLSTSYDVVRGDLGVLRASGGDFSVATAQCLAGDREELALPYAASPVPGQGFWFLVRGAHCIEGSYDAGPGQQGTRDAEIGASPGACPD